MSTAVGLGINDRGDVVGASIDGPLENGASHPFIWQNGVMSDLNALMPADSSLLMLVVATRIAGNGGPAARGAARLTALPENASKALRR